MDVDLPLTGNHLRKRALNIREQVHVEWTKVARDRIQ
jgi:hypothetical protein